MKLIVCRWLCVFLFVLPALTGQGQNQVSDITITELTPGTLTITFRPLQKFDADKYLELSYSVNDSSDFTYRTPTRLSGDDVYQASYKAQYVITWKYTEEDFKYEPTKMVFAVRGRLQSLGGGPLNALFSVIVPGLGDRFVNPAKKGSGVPYAIVALAGIGIGGLWHWAANDYYTQYENLHFDYKDSPKQFQEQMDSYHSRAEQCITIASICYTVGIAAWIADIGRVAYKGYRNNQFRAHKASHVSLRPEIIPNSFSPFTGICLKYRF